MHTKPAGRGGGMKWLWIVLGIAALAILAWILIQLFNAEPSGGPEEGVGISDITENPQEYYGQDVNVSGEVGELIGPNAFTIGTQDAAAGGTLLVVGAKQLPNVIEGGEELASDDVVQARGTVREFNVTEIEDEIGYGLDDGLFEEFEGEPAIVANAVDMTAE
jgi:hypothetical protein